MLLGIFGALTWFAIFVVLKWSYFHLYKVIDRGKYSTRFFLLCVIGNIITTWLVTVGTEKEALLLHVELCGAFAMACFFVVYMPFYYTIATSLSIQTLIALAKNEGELPVSQLMQRFASEEFVKERLITMARNGYVFRSGAIFYPSNKGLVLSKVFSSIKKMWRLGPGG